jgi:3-phytase
MAISASALVAVAVVLIAAQADVGVVVRPQARAQTAPVPHKNDAADDPAIWVHPDQPELSLILGTNKQGGLHVYNMDGSEHQIVSPTAQPDNVDVLYGFPLAGKPTDLAIAGCRNPASLGVKIWSIDAGMRRLTDVTSGGVIKVFNGSIPYGSCNYTSRKTGQHYFFVNHKDGRIEQHQLVEKRGLIDAKRVRELKIKSTPEGCAADDELGHFYLAEENVGVWKFNAEPDGGDARTLIAKVGQHGLTADVEGLTIYCAADGRGYLIVSSQGNNTFKVYERQGNNKYLVTIDPRSGAIDDVSETDGIAVTNCPTSAQFPSGFLVVQDGSNAGGKNQNFKIYGWEDIAAGHLIIDPSWNPRRK